ncbi:MAG: heavy-metal-associated domain-containing protein [Bacteriovoracaceae bacterium]|nr:heavy-metal-associated domain-containing protein [Bacteriovoracaceae bacterium]
MKKFLIACLLISGSAMAKDITIKVNGMVCSLCAQGIEKKFKDVSEVSSIKVDLDNKVVFLTTKGDLDINDESITKIITGAGYNVASIERK